MTNIGFDLDGSHYTEPDHPHALLPTAPMRFPLRHPSEVAVDTRSDMIEWSLLHPRLAPRSPIRRAASRLQQALARLAGRAAA